VRARAISLGESRECDPYRLLRTALERAAGADARIGPQLADAAAIDLIARWIDELD